MVSHRGSPGQADSWLRLEGPCAPDYKKFILAETLKGVSYYCAP